MSHKLAKKVRQKYRKEFRKDKKEKSSVALEALQEIARLPLKQRLWFAWRIVVMRRFS